MKEQMQGFNFENLNDDDLKEVILDEYLLMLAEEERDNSEAAFKIAQHKFKSHNIEKITRMRKEPQDANMEPWIVINSSTKRNN